MPYGYDYNYLNAPPPGAYPYYPGYAPAAPPQQPYYSGLYRSRSHGHAPAPQVNIYETIQQRQSPSHSPGVSPDRRGRQLLDDYRALEVVDRLEQRSRSRGRSDAALWQLEQVKQQEAEEEAVRRYREREAKEAAERKAAVQAYKLKEEEEKAEAKELRERIRIEDETKRLKEKEEHDRWRLKLEQEAQEKKDKEKAEYEKWKLKMDLEEAEKKRKKKEEEEKVNEEVAARLRRVGLSEGAIERINSKEETRTEVLRRITSNTQREQFLSGHTPKYPKIKREYLARETLLYYNLPFKIAEDDANYYVIMKELDRRDTDILFEHTRRLRKGKEALLIEGAKPRKELQWVRRRSKSPARRLSNVQFAESSLW